MFPDLTSRIEPCLGLQVDSEVVRESFLIAGGKVDGFQRSTSSSPVASRHELVARPEKVWLEYMRILGGSRRLSSSTIESMKSWMGLGEKARVQIVTLSSAAFVTMKTLLPYLTIWKLLVDWYETALASLKGP